MKTIATPLIKRNIVFAWIALASIALLLIPFIAMQFTSAVNWSVGDFVVMGGLLFTAGSAFVIAARMVHRDHRWAVGALVAIVFVYVWAELAVGVFTNLGS